MGTGDALLFFYRRVAPDNAVEFACAIRTHTRAAQRERERERERQRFTVEFMGNRKHSDNQLHP